MKLNILLLYSLGALVLIYIQYKAYTEYLKSKQYKQDIQDQNFSKDIALVRSLEETYERKPCLKKTALLFSHDHSIQFAGISNVDKINKIEELINYNFNFLVLKFLNVKNAKNVLHETLDALNKEVLHGTQTLVFIWIAGLATKILVDDKIEDALVFGDDVISESKWKEIFRLYTNLKFICAFEPCNMTYTPKLPVFIKNQINEDTEEWKEENFLHVTSDNYKIVPIQYHFQQEIQSAPRLDFYDLSGIINKKIEWEINFASKEIFSNFIWNFSHTNLLNIFFTFIAVTGNKFTIESLLDFFDSQGVKQYVSHKPQNQMENIL